MSEEKSFLKKNSKKCAAAYDNLNNISHGFQDLIILNGNAVINDEFSTFSIGIKSLFHYSHFCFVL